MKKIPEKFKMLMRINDLEFRRNTIDGKDFAMRFVEKIRISRSQVDFQRKFENISEIIAGLYIMKYCNPNNKDMKNRTILDYLSEYLKIEYCQITFLPLYNICNSKQSVFNKTTTSKANIIYNIISKRSSNILRKINNFQEEGNFITLDKLLTILSRFDNPRDFIVKIYKEILEKFKILNELGYIHRNVNEFTILYNSKGIKISNLESIYFVGLNNTKINDKINDKISNIKDITEIFKPLIDIKELDIDFDLAAHKHAFYENYKDEFIESVSCNKLSEDVNVNLAMNLYNVTEEQVRVIIEDSNNHDNIPFDFFPLKEMVELTLELNEENKSKRLEDLEYFERLEYFEDLIFFTNERRKKFLNVFSE